MIVNLGSKITSMRDIVSVVQDRTQILFGVTSDLGNHIISYIQPNSDGGLKFIAYLERAGVKLSSSATISSYRVDLNNWSETPLFQNLSMTQNPDLTLTLDRTLSQVGVDTDGEFLILVDLKVIRQSKIFYHKYYVSDVGIYNYADFIRRKTVFLSVTKKDFP